MESPQLRYSSIGSFQTGRRVHEQAVAYVNNAVFLHEDISSASEAEADPRRVVLSALTPTNFVGGNEQHKGIMDSIALPSAHTWDTTKVGKAGVRKRRRWNSDYFHHANIEDHLHDTLEEARRDFYNLMLPNTQTAFQQLHDNPRHWARFTPFMDLTDDVEDEARLLRELQRRTRPEVPRKPAKPTTTNDADLTPHQRWKRLSKEERVAVRRVLKGCAHDEEGVLARTEAVCVAMVSDPTETTAEMLLASAVERKLCHAVAHYYGLHTRSEDQELGRVVHLWRPKGIALALPTVPFLQYTAPKIVKGGQAEGRRRRRRPKQTTQLEEVEDVTEDDN